MELCLGDSALRRVSFRPEPFRTVPITSKSSGSRLRTRALGFGSQPWAAKRRCFQLFLVSACKASFRPELLRTLPITSKSSVSRLRTRALGFGSQPWAPKRRCFQLVLVSACERFRVSSGSSFQTSLRVSQLLCIGSGDWESSSGPSREVFTATDLAAGSLDLQGWKVLLKETREVVGVVDEIIHIGSAGSDDIFESLLKLVYISGPQDKDETSEAEDGEEADYLEFLVPLVEDIVREVDVINKCLFITPPEGLLELARIPQLLKDLEPQLLDFCQQENDGIRGCLNVVRASKNRRFSDDAKQMMAWTRVFDRERLDIFMPTRRQLISAGRHNLVEDIMAAGGFLSVAQALKLPSRRRPNGFWEDLRNLDAEIEWFVSGSWTKEEDLATGETVYSNQATGEVSSQEPSPGSVFSPVPVSQDSFDVGTAVMPRQRKVLEAGRYDLHHAILAHGGYKLVAQELGRQPVSKDTTTQIVSKIKCFMEEQSISHFPSLKEIKAQGRYDLAYLLRRHGGLNVVADMMDIRPKKYGSGQWSHLEVAAVAIRAYMCNKLIFERGLSEISMDRSDLEDMVWKDALRAGTLEIPTQSSFLKDDRSDLRYLLQKFGRKKLSEHLGVVKDVIPKGRRLVSLRW